MDETQKLKLKKRIESHIISKDDCWTTNYYISLSRGGKQQNITIDGKSFDTPQPKGVGILCSQTQLAQTGFLQPK